MCNFLWSMIYWRQISKTIVCQNLRPRHHSGIKDLSPTCDSWQLYVIGACSCTVSECCKICLCNFTPFRCMLLVWLLLVYGSMHVRKWSWHVCFIWMWLNVCLNSAKHRSNSSPRSHVYKSSVWTDAVVWLLMVCMFESQAASHDQVSSLSIDQMCTVYMSQTKLCIKIEAKCVGIWLLASSDLVVRLCRMQNDACSSHPQVYLISSACSQEKSC